MENVTEIFPPGYPLENDDEFEITHKELDQIKEALKDANFRKLLSEYVEDIQSPESQSTYQDEVRQLEKQRGNTIHFLNPIPGYVIKTSVNGEKKAFINICSNPLIRKLSCKTTCQSGKNGCWWSIPYAQSPPREDLDKAGKICMVYDIIFNPTTILLSQKHSQLKAKIDSTALDAVEKSFNVTLDKNNIKRPKIKFKGMTKATVIKYKTGETPPDILEVNAMKTELPPQPREIYSGSIKKSTDCAVPKFPKSGESDNGESAQKLNRKIGKQKGSNEKTSILSNPESIAKFTKPNYKLKYRSHVDMQDYCFDSQREGRSAKAIPQEIILIIDLPMLKDSSTIDADVTGDGKGFELKTDGKIKYHLNINLPFQVCCDAVKATFDKDKRKLTINMKTLQKKYNNCCFATQSLEPDMKSEVSPLVQCLDEDGTGEMADVQKLQSSKYFGP